ncbi:hypothetical protein PRIC1_004872 [Phytophthora ramorum]|uniref:uncharacterized protein n=1 Tax=Phytophthora ramorum TaxID=164328 RepID=UPI0030A66E59|nr:hypothetical protein KRP23_4627 [Phytophthora ramorum]
MMARRQTGSEKEAFTDRLEGLTPAERQRVVKEHNAYLNGERVSDADFGSAAPDIAESVAVALASTRAAPSRPPRGKDACYLANAKALAARRLAEDAAAKKKAAGKKMSKSQAAAIRKAEKAAKEARAVARSAKAALAKKNERKRLAAEELRGREARMEASKQLRQKARGEAAEKKKSRPATKAKRKAPPESDSGRKKKHTKTSRRDRQTADEESAMEPRSEWCDCIPMLYNAACADTDNVVYGVI